MVHCAKQLTLDTQEVKFNYTLLHLAVTLRVVPCIGPFLPLLHLLGYWQFWVLSDLPKTQISFI